MADQHFITAEVWCPVSGYERVYEVSSLGRVRRCDGYHATSNPLRPATNHHGYLNVNLSHNCKGRTFFVHRLVCEAFLGPRPLGLKINHKNGIKTDNSVENLEYITHAENMAHAKNVLGVMKGLHGDLNVSRRYPERLSRGENVNTAVLTASKVLEIKQMLSTGARQCDIAKHFGISETQIWRIKNNTTWRHVLLSEEAA